VNPDGAVMGHLCNNSLWPNLNREWASSSVPEKNQMLKSVKFLVRLLPLKDHPRFKVCHVLCHIDEKGCNAFLSIHRDEDLPFNFLTGGQGMLNGGKRMKASFHDFI